MDLVNARARSIRKSVLRSALFASFAAVILLKAFDNENAGIVACFVTVPLILKIIAN
jgi:hypothetical protein